MSKLSRLSGKFHVTNNIAFTDDGEHYFSGTLSMSRGDVPIVISEYLAVKFHDEDVCEISGILVTEHKESHMFTYFLVRDIASYGSDAEEINEIHVTGKLTKKYNFVVGDTSAKDHIVGIVYTNIDQQQCAVTHIYARGRFARELQAMEVNSKVEVSGYLTVKNALSVTVQQLSSI